MRRVVVAATLILLMLTRIHAEPYTFRYEDTGVKSVSVAGDWNGWSRTANPLREESPGTWRATIDLPPGQRQYRLVIDDRFWIEDPANAEKFPNGMGEYNSVISMARYSTRKPENGVPRARLARLKKGVNLAHWFWSAPLSHDVIRARFSDAELDRVQELGFTVVRLPIDMRYLFDGGDADLLNDSSLAVLDLELNRLLARDLAVIVDLHSLVTRKGGEEPRSSDIEEDGELQNLLVRFWRELARHHAKRDPERILFEPLNEPVFEGKREEWLQLQQRLLRAIRAEAPHHTILATPNRWSSLDELAGMETLEDTNIVYTFHFYEPFVFTHQGATWTWKPVQPLRRVPYPIDTARIRSAMKGVDDSAALQVLRWYEYENWNAARIARRMETIRDWAGRNNVSVLCGEFGAYAAFTDTADRVRWLADARTALEQCGIGWCLWEYDRGFGIMKRDDSRTIVDAAVAEALGLSVNNNAEE